MGFGLVYTLVSVIWGYSALIIYPNIDNPDVATPTMLSSELVPTVLGVIVMVGIMAAAVSTIDSILLTLSSLFARDVYGNLKKGSSDKRQLTVGKIIIPIIAIMAYGFAQLQLDLIAVLSVASSAGLCVTVPALIGAFFWKRGTAPAVLTSVTVSGILVLILEMIQLKPFNLGSGVWGIVSSTILFIGVSLATKAPAEKANEFMGYIKTELKKNLKSSRQNKKDLPNEKVS
jgi:SSS family solute:Na+ symporter